MDCPRCQAPNRDAARFCEECGCALVAVCPSCRAEIVPSNRFCGSCGAKLPGDRHEGAAAAAPLAAERKQVTVLFADMADSTARIAGLDAEDARALLDRTVARMMDAVHRYEGTVTQITGDGIIALFGAPLAYEDHAARACYAALAMLDAVHRAGGEPPHHALRIRVGLNSGEVVVRAIRNDLRFDYAAVGGTVALAARMEQLARPGSVLVAPATQRLVAGLFDVEQRGPLAVKGLREELTAFELMSARPARTRLQATAAAVGLSPLVGRAAELAQLAAMLDDSADGGRVVALVGEAGVGKSRLAHEFAGLAERRGWDRLEAHTAPYASHTAYFAIVQMLRARFGIGDSDRSEAIGGRLAAALGPLLQDTLPAFRWLLDLPAEDPAWEALPAAGRRGRVRQAMKRLFQAASAVRPVLLIVEDLHWADAETRDLLAGVAELLPTARVLLLLTCRPDFEHGWSGRGGFTQVALQPLGPAMAEQLLAGLIGDDASTRPLRRLLVQHTRGNPLFLEENVRALIEAGVLVGGGAAYRAAVTPDRIAMPASVHAVLAARIDRLAPEDKRLLQACAAIGMRIPSGLLGAVAGLTADRLAAGLRRLQAAEFLTETALFPEPEYVFRHALIHEVASGGLLREQRAGLHAAILAGIERLYPDRLAEHVESLARHAVQGELWDKAVHYLERAGVQAVARSSHRTAVTFLEQALQALRHWPEGRARDERTIELHFAARNALWPLSDHAAIDRHLVEAEALATGLQDSRRLGWIASFRVQHYRMLGDTDNAIRSGEYALAVARAANDVELQVDTGFRVGLMCLTVGQYARATAFLEGTLGEAPAAPRTAGRAGLAGFRPATSRAWLAVCLAEQGRFVDAVARAQEAIDIARRAQSAYSHATGLFGLGTAQILRGEVEPACATLLAGIELCERHDIPVVRRLTAAQLGQALVRAGRVGDALRLLEEGAEIGSAAPSMARHALYLTWLGEAYLAAGRQGEAEQTARQALEISRRRGERGHEAWALHLGAAVARRGDPPAASAMLAAAVALADELGMRPLAATARLAQAELLRDLGRADAATVIEAPAERD